MGSPAASKVVTCIVLSLLAAMGTFDANGLRAEDCNQNGVEDGIEISMGLASDCDENGVPDACDVVPAWYGFRFHAINAATSNDLVRTADVNADARPDLVAADWSNKEIVIMTNQGLARFGVAARILLTETPIRMAIGDVEGDGREDIFVHSDFNSIRVFRSQADGSFVEQILEPPGLRFVISLVADLNRDGRSDLAITEFDGSLLIRLATPTGDYAEAQRIPGIDGRKHLVATDVDGDGVVDIVASGDSALRVVRGLGDGRFEARPITTPVDERVLQLRAADLNGDSIPDLLMGTSHPYQLLLLEGLGDGRFNLVATHHLAPLRPVLVDLDRDGLPDLLGPGSSWQSLSVLRGLGGFRFAPADPPVTSRREDTLVPADLDGDGRTDLAAAQASGRELSIWLDRHPATSQPDCNGNGRPDRCDLASGLSRDRNRDDVPDECQNLPLVLDRPQTLAEGDGPHSLVAEDLDGDGRTDVAVALARAGEILFIAGTEDGRLVERRRLAPADLLRPVDLATADLEGDGFVDIVVADLLGDSVVVLHGDSRGTGDGFPRLSDGYPAGDGPQGVAAEDLDGDGRLDIVTANLFSDDVSVILQRFDGTFHSPQSFSVGSGPQDVVVLDLDGDGLPDVATANYGSDDISVLRGRGDGTIGPARHHRAGWGPTALRSIELAETELPGLAVVLERTDEILILGRGRFPSYDIYRTLDVGEAPRQVLTADLDDDGLSDFVTANQLSGDVSVIRRNGERYYREAVHFPAGGSPRDLVVGDFDHDGFPDVVVANWISGDVVLLRNVTGIDELGCGARPAPTRCAVFRRGDINDDLRVDVADAIAIIRHIFLYRGNIPCNKAADVDDDGLVEITDPIGIIDLLYRSGGVPPSPFEDCGLDPTADWLSCAEPPTSCEQEPPAQR